MMDIQNTLNFKYKNLSLILQKIMYRLRLTHRSSHLRLSLECEIPYRRSMKPKLARTHTGFSKPTHSYVPQSRQSMSAPTPVPPQRTSPKNFEKMIPADIRKLHTKLGQATATQLQLFLKEAEKWKNRYHDCIRSKLQNCECVLSNLQLARLVCSISSRPTEIRNIFFVDIIFFNNKPFP